MIPATLIFLQALTSARTISGANNAQQFHMTDVMLAAVMIHQLVALAQQTTVA
jgi:hypothetical protein